MTADIYIVPAVYYNRQAGDFNEGFLLPLPFIPKYLIQYSLCGGYFIKVVQYLIKD